MDRLMPLSVRGGAMPTLVVPDIPPDPIDPMRAGVGGGVADGIPPGIAGATATFPAAPPIIAGAALGAPGSCGGVTAIPPT